MLKQFIEAKLLKANDDGFTFIASDETLDRSGEVIPIESWDLKNYKRNPVLLVNHDYKVENIVGGARKLRIEDGKMLFDAMFHEITQLSREVKEMVKGGFLNTVSVGFMRKSPKKDGDKEQNELFEISFVPVPANPSAERLKAIMAEAEVKAAEKTAIEEWIIKEEKEETPVDDDDDDDELAIKEGRVLSGKNRKLIDDAVGVLKNALGALEQLLQATEQPPKDARDENAQGREPKVVQVQEEAEPKGKADSTVVRALQAIAKSSNEALRLIKQK